MKTIKIFFSIFSFIYLLFCVYLIFLTEVDIVGTKRGYGLISLYFLFVGFFLVLKYFRKKLMVTLIGFLLICASCFSVYQYVTTPTSKMKSISNEYIVKIEKQIMKMNFGKEFKNLDNINNAIERITNKSDIFYEDFENANSDGLLQSISVLNYQEPVDLNLKIDLFMDNECAENVYRNKIPLDSNIIQEIQQDKGIMYFITKQVAKTYALNNRESSLVIKSQNMIIEITNIKNIEENLYLSRLLNEIEKI